MASGVISASKEVSDTVEKGMTPVLSVKNLVTRFDIRSGLFGRTAGAVHAVEKYLV